MNKKFLIFLVAILLALTVGLVIKVGTSYATCGIQTEPIIIDFHSELSADQTSVVFYYKISSNSSNRCGNPLYIYLENVPDQAPSILIVLKDGNWSGTTSGYTSSYPVSNLPNGTYVVRLEAQVSANVSGSVTATFTINNRPTCTISAPASVNTGQTFNASASMTGGSGGYKNFAWNFGDGTTGISQSSIHSYSLAGNYTITFTFLDSRSSPGKCTSPISVTGAPPTPALTATLTANPTSVAPGGVPIMSWGSTNAANCSVLAGAGFHTGGAVQGSCNTTPGAGCPSPLAGTTTFSIRCYEFADKTGRTADAAVTVTVLRLNASAVGECQQNYPSSAVQSYISWNAVPGATSYTVKESRFLLDRTVGTTSGTSVIDRNVSFGSSYSYYVIAYDGSGKEIIRSSVTSATTPASCSGAPACSGGTYVISPFSQSTTVGSTASFTSLYDPDGGGNSRYGNFNVTNSAPWVSNRPSVASSQGGGRFRGESAGTAPISSTFCSIPASGSLDVVNPAQEDFTCSVSPGNRDVQRPGSAGYTISVTPSNGFDRNVTLSVSGLPAGVSGSPSPVTISGGSGSSVLNLNVSSNAGVGLSTFTVDCKSGSITRSPTAKINVTAPAGGFSCTLVPNPPDSAPTSVSVSISGGVAPYKCVGWEGQPFDTSCTPHSCGDAVNGCSLNLGVSDSATPKNVTQCSVNIAGTKPPPCNSPDLIYVNFRVGGSLMLYSDFKGASDPQFTMSKDGINFLVDKNRLTQSSFYMGQIIVNPGEYKFVSWNSPDNYVVDHIVYNFGRSSSIDITQNKCDSGNLDIYLKKAKDLLIIDAYIPEMAGDKIATETVSGETSEDTYCKAGGDGNPTFNLPAGAVSATLKSPSGITSSYGLGNQYEFGSASLPYGNYSVVDIQTGNGYRLVTLPECAPRHRKTSLLEKNVFVGLLDGFGLLPLVNKAFAAVGSALDFTPFIPTQTGYSPTSFTSAQGQPDVYIHTYIAPKSDYCTLSGPGSVLPGMSAALSWTCSKPPKTCSLTDSKGNTLVSNKVYPGTSSTSTQSLTEKTVFTLTCIGGVDPSSVTVNVGYAPVIREIIPR